MKNYTIILQGKEINITQNEDGTFNKPDFILELEKQGTATKPAHEPICMARKPLEKGLTVTENCLKWGTGGINIDESRVEVDDTEKEHFEKEWDMEQSMSAELGGVAMNKGLKAISLRDNVPTGRFPANLIHDNSEEVRECFPESGGGKFSKSGNRVGGNCEYSVGINGRKDAPDNYGDSGNASRFFKSIIYTAKASKRDRGDGNTHPTVKPVALMEYLIKMVTTKGGIVLDPFAGSGTTLVAAKTLNRNYIGFEITSEYEEIANKRLDNIIDLQPKLF